MEVEYRYAAKSLRGFVSFKVKIFLPVCCPMKRKWINIGLTENTIY
jgi:hypothetical protein